LSYSLDPIRPYHAGSVLGQLIETVVHPDDGTDKELDDILRKIKGRWEWTQLEGPPTEWFEISSQTPS
jgi:hypothetical protein